MRCIINKFASILIASFLILVACAISFGQNISAEPVSAEARRYFTRGLAAVEMARSPVDYDLAIEEFTKARSLAPDWPDVHYNLGLVQEKAGKFKDAAASLNRYLQLAPDGPDAESVRNLMTRLEFKAEQVITDDDALNIFGSLSDRSIWQLKGVTPNDSLNVLRIQVSGRDGRQIVISYWHVANQPPRTMRETPHGKTLSFITIYNLCSQLFQGKECPEVNRHSLEIVSRRLVKMSVKRFWPQIGTQMDAHVSDFSYEFVRVR